MELWALRMGGGGFLGFGGEVTLLCGSQMKKCMGSAWNLQGTLGVRSDLAVRVFFLQSPGSFRARVGGLNFSLAFSVSSFFFPCLFVLSVYTLSPTAIVLSCLSTLLQVKYLLLG